MDKTPIVDTTCPETLNSDVSDSVLEGYKRVPSIGTIPEDWEHVRVGDVAKVKGGKRLPFGFTLVDSSTPHPYVRVSDMYPGGVDQSAIKYVPEQASTIIKNYRIYREDIFISIAGTLGIVGVVPAELSGANLTENAARITDLRCERDYLKYWLMSQPIQQTNESIRTIGAQPKLALERIAKLEITTPQNRGEQCAIGEALSDVDDLLVALEKLIAKRRAIKQAAMQQLLTGKTRLPGFSGEWETRRLGSLGVFLKGRGIKREDVSDTGFPCIRYGELYTRYENYILNAVARILSPIAELALPIKTGDLLFSGSGETSEEIGRCAAYLGNESAFAGGDVVVLTYLDQNLLYLGYLMNYPTVTRQKARMSQGDAVVHISARSLAQIEIDLPPVEEQAAIAAVLSNMDAEIAALERRRDKTRALKQGMMQQLLTGKIRLVESAETTTRQVSAASTGKKHNWQFNEAVVIAVLTKHFGDEKYPLSRTRYTKLSYLLHRYSEGRAEGYLKKAAGPYNPSTRYGGPETIALKNGYVYRHENDKYSGFISGENIQRAENYFAKWYGEDCLRWLDQFRCEKRDDLELLTTADLAVEELRKAGKVVSVEGVRRVIHSDPEWKAKLNRSVFSSTNIARAIERCRRLFGVRDERPKT